VERDEITALAITLNHLINDLRASAARERQLVSDASHELRTPLAVLQAQLELLRTGDRATLDSDILAAERAAARLTHLVNSLLDLSRLEADNPPAPANIGWLLDEAGEAIDRARLQAVSDDVKIDLTVSGPATALGDVLMPRLVYGRVLNNLLSNALHACDGRGHIIVTIEHGSMSFITVVTDDGAGIPAEFLPHAFDRFSQGDASPGAGLGLAIVAAAVAAAGGTVTIENTVPSGLDVTITLPVIHEL
jgi:signal transduction histidine kinase